MARPSRYTPELAQEYLKKGYWEKITVPDMWDRNARDFPDHEALVDSRTRVTWSQGNRLIDRLALGLLDMGMKRDEALVLQLPNCVEIFLLRVACAKAGVLCVPALRTLREREMAYVLNYVEAAGIVIPWKFKGFDYLQMVRALQPQLPRLKHIVIKGEEAPEGTVSLAEMMNRTIEREYPPDYLQETRYGPDDVALIFLTSGTTGLPKFVEFPGCARLYSTRVRTQHLGLDDRDVIGAFLPAAIGPNAIAYYGAPRVAARTAILESFEAEAALEMVQRERVTVLSVVPTALHMIVNHPDLPDYDLGSLRMILTSASSLPYQLGLEAEAKLKCPILQDYGTADFGGLTLNFPGDSRHIRLTTVGKPYPGVEIILVDESGVPVPQGEVGEIWARGPTSLTSYYKDPEGTAQSLSTGGWFKTGDLGKFDGQGNLTIAGRRKEMIIRGGQNIYPAEIETLLVTHPGVSAAAVIGMPDPLMGEKACAYVALKPGQSFSMEEMINYLKDRNIALYKLPERLEIRDSLPVLGEQKIDKKVLVQDLNAKLRAEAHHG